MSRDPEQLIPPHLSFIPPCFSTDSHTTWRGSGGTCMEKLLLFKLPETYWARGSVLSPFIRSSPCSNTVSKMRSKFALFCKTKLLSCILNALVLFCFLFVSTYYWLLPLTMSFVLFIVLIFYIYIPPPKHKLHTNRNFAVFLICNKPRLSHRKILNKQFWKKEKMTIYLFL